MGLFSKKPSAEEIAALEENRKRLDDFEVTAAWGVKKVATAKQFIYDEKNRNFVVVDGPEDSFKERNPWIIGFDQVKDVYLEVDEWWTETNDKHAIGRGYGILTQDRYDEVYWRYNLYMVIETDHPYAKTIKYAMNSSPIITKVQGLHLLVRRGLELNGVYRGKEIGEQIVRLEKLIEDETKALGKERGLDLVTGKNRGESIFKGVVTDMVEDHYIKRIEFAIKHMQRVQRVAKLFLNN